MTEMVVLPQTRARAWLRIEDFVMLHNAGSFAEDGKTELIEGEIFRVNAQFVRHAYAKSLLHLAIDRGLRAIDSPLIVLVEASVAMPPFDMPEPDLVITEKPSQGGPLSFNAVALVVEVADTTRLFDLGRKAFVYARSRIPEYWVVDLTGNVVVRHWAPGETGYAESDSVAIGEAVVSMTIEGLVVTTGELIALPEKD